MTHQEPLDPNGRTKPWGAFLYRDYRFLWLTLMTSSIVMWMRILGTAQWILNETGSAYLVGLIGVVQLVVQIPVTLWAGTLADHMDRKRLIALSQGVTGVTLLALGLLGWFEQLTLSMVYIGIAVTAGTQMLVSPARSALVAIVVSKRDLMVASSTDTASANAAAVAGPLLFAVIAVSTNLTIVFLMAGAISLVASLVPAFVRARGVAEGHDDGPARSRLQQTRDGFSYVANFARSVPVGCGYHHRLFLSRNPAGTGAGSICGWRQCHRHAGRC